MYGVLEKLDLSDEDDLHILLELKESIKHDPLGSVRYLESVLWDVAEKYDLCPECLANLGERQLAINYGEVWGSAAVQVEYEAYCPKCGWERG